MTPPKNEPQGIEKRGRTFYVTGHALSLLIGAAFAVTLAFVYFVGEGWQSWIYQGTTDLSEACAYAGAHGTPTITPEADVYAPIRLRHKLDRTQLRGTADGSPGDIATLRYRCQIPALYSGEVSYAHWGWIAGSDVRVTSAGHLLASFSGTQKLVLPVVSGDTLYLEIKQPLATLSRAGFVGTQQPALATGFQRNNKLFGIDSFLLITRALTYLIPIVSLGMVLGLAWFGGFRSRNLTVAMYVMIWALLHHSITLALGIFDTNVHQIGILTAVVKLGFGIGFLLFHMEVGRVRPKAIYPIARWSTALLCILALVPAAAEPAVAKGVFILGHLLIGLSSLAIAFAIRGKSGLQYRVVFATSIVVGLIFLSDAYVRSQQGSLVFLANALQIILPLYVAIFLQSVMSFSDKKFWKERHHNLQLTEIVDLESARVSTLSRFLPKTLVNQFATKESIDQNLTRVLMPHVENVAVIQADMRGFSRLVAGRGEAEVVNLLRTCFGPVVDHAQKFAMVKLIGDCLFAFIQSGNGAKTPVDQAIEIAAHLIRQVQRVNHQEGLNETDGIRFGIGISYGKAVVGNLSADSCIDYTAIGEPVNLAARLEELTKDTTMTTHIGRNGVLLSEAAAAATARYAVDPDHVIDLTWVKVRSFDRIQKVCFLTEHECLQEVFGTAMSSEEPRTPTDTDSRRVA